MKLKLGILFFPIFPGLFYAAKNVQGWPTGVSVKLVIRDQSYWLGEEPRTYLEFYNSKGSRLRIDMNEGGLGTWYYVELRKKEEVDWPKITFENSHFVHMSTFELKPGEMKTIALGPPRPIPLRSVRPPWFTEPSSDGSYELRCLVANGRPADGVWTDRWVSEIVLVEFKRMKLVVPRGTRPEDIELLKEVKRRPTFRNVLLFWTHRSDLEIELTELGARLKGRLPEILPLVVANLHNPRYQMPLIGLVKEARGTKALPWMRPLVRGDYPFASERECLVVWAIAHMMNWNDGIGYAVRWFNERARAEAIKWIASNIAEPAGSFPGAKSGEDSIEMEDD